MDRIPNDVRRTGQPSRKKRKRRIEREKDKEAGGGDMAWKKQSSRTLLQFKSHTQRKRLKGRIEREKNEEAGGADMAWNSKIQSSRTLLQFKSHTQEELKKIYGKRTERNVEVTFGSNYVQQDSESSEEEEGISEEEFKKTEGWKLFKEALDAHANCSKSGIHGGPRIKK